MRNPFSRQQRTNQQIIADHLYSAEKFNEETPTTEFTPEEQQATSDYIQYLRAEFKRYSQGGEK